MRITQLLKEEGIILNVNIGAKSDAIDMLVDLQYKSGTIKNKEMFKKAILERESMSTTAIGEGIAIPHAKSTFVEKPGIVAITVPNGIDYDSMDGKPSNLFFMIAAPESGANVHLQALSRLSVILVDETFREKLLNAVNTKEFLKIIDEKENEKFGEEKKIEKKLEDPKNHVEYRILAVTACPTGIAHTFMAAETLEKKAKEMGYSLKVETNGSGGTKNLLTKDEIEAADGIIVAADKNVEMMRFEGKKVLKVKVADGIHKPEELIKKVVEGAAPVYHHNTSVSKNEIIEDREGYGHQIYKHLMNGVSHMLPFVIGGGILIAIAFLLDDYSINPNNFGMNTPIAAFFKSVGGTAFGFMLPILAGYIAMSIADRPGLAVGFVGGALAASGMTFANPTGDISAGFLGALLAGFVGGYLVLALRKFCDKLPDSLEGIKSILVYPLFGILLIGLIMCSINPFVAMLNTMLTNGLNSMGSSSKILLGCVLGGMMSIDMGGPFNKAAYVFGTAAIASKGYDIMAAVMVGGMVPPLALALATTFFRKKFTESERKSGIVNYIMGLCFITEGAIPFAASDPLRVIPSCVIGSAVAGGISMAMGCTLMAPHGGIFVLPVIGSRLGFIIALAVGSLVGMLLLAILKRNRVEN